MIDSPRFCQLQHLHAPQGLHASQSAQAVSLDPPPVSSWLAPEHCRPRKSRQRPSQLDPCKAPLVRLLERYPYAAAQVFQRLREHGFDGG